MAGRKSKRIKLAVRVSVGFLGARVHFTGELVTVSANGLLVRSSEKLEPGTMGRLGIDVGSETFRAIGIVRSLVPGDGIGFQFVQMSQHSRELLHRLMLRLDMDTSSSSAKG